MHQMITTLPKKQGKKLLGIINIYAISNLFNYELRMLNSELWWLTNKKENL
jgi:hypothetical protein